MHDRGDVSETSKPSGFSFPGVYSARRSSRVPRRTSSSFSDERSSMLLIRSSSVMTRGSRSLSRSRVAHGASGVVTRCDVATLNPPLPLDGLNTRPRGGPGTDTRRESLLLSLDFRPSPPKCSARRDDRVLPLVVDRSGLVYVLDGVNDGDSRWSPGILRER